MYRPTIKTVAAATLFAAVGVPAERGHVTALIRNAAAHAWIQLRTETTVAYADECVVAKPHAWTGVAPVLVALCSAMATNVWIRLRMI